MRYGCIAADDHIPGAPASRCRGSTLLFLIAALVILASLSAALASLTGSAIRTTLSNANEQRAYYLALSGLNCWSRGRTGTFHVNGDSFTLTEAGPDAAGYYTVTSLGCVLAGATNVANVLLTTRRKGLGPITFDRDIGDFKPPVVGKNTNNAKAIVVFDKDLSDPPPGFSEAEWTILWTEKASRYAGGWMQLGGGATNSHGAIWYGGDHGDCPDGACPDGMCAAGCCTLGPGLRAYFVFSFSDYDSSSDSRAYADGFTFTVATAANDPDTAAGGPASGSRGEYLGYAGPGPAGKGVAPPKLAVEIDIYPNKGTGRATDANSRADAGDANHVAVVAWGAPGASYDDNVHGAGTAPGNPPNASPGYYGKAKTPGGPNWLEDGLEHAMRVELHRADAAAGGSYRVRVWVDPQNDGHDDVTADYTAESPQLDHTLRLAAADHAGLDAIRFGWTEGTGSKNQTVALHDFSLDFRH